MKNMVFVGPLWMGSTSRQRMLAFSRLCALVEPIDTTTPTGKRLGPIGARFGRHLGFDLDLANANQQLINAVSNFAPDLVWVEKGLTIQPGVLSDIKVRYPSTRLVAYSPDDMLLPANQSRAYRRSIALYDWHVTHKSFNVDELTGLGARRVYYIPKAYDEETYFPYTLTQAETLNWGGDVSFLGGFEPQRFETMLAAAKLGVHIRIFGPGWRHAYRAHPNLDVRDGWVQAADAARVFSATKINLAFLRKVARDLHTARSVEIPACKAFMLAERTQEHQDLFQEGLEADYFSDVGEMVAKITDYLCDDERRLAVADAGRRRCLISGYSNEHRLRTILEVVSS